MFSLKLDSPELIGYLIILTIVPFLIAININALWEKLKPKELDKCRSKWHPDYIGRLDLLLYLTAFLIERPEFIIAWLTIKTIPRVLSWEKMKLFFNIFLIGNSLLIISAFITAEIVKLIRDGRIELAVIIGLSWIIFNFWTYYKTTKSETIDLNKQKDVVEKLIPKVSD